MLSATIGVKADLSDYPEMFVTDGTFDGYLVVGENAQLGDVLVASDITSNMKIESTEPATTSGDSWQASGLEVANNDASSVQGENLRDVSSYIGKNELGALADGSYKTKGGSYVYKQYLNFDVNNVDTNELVKYAENENDEYDLFFFIKSGENIAQYKLEFSPSAKSDIYDSTGATSSSGTVLRDMEDTKISMLGKEYTLVLAQRPLAGGVKLTLMEGAVSDNLQEGVTEKYQLNDKSYEVSLIYVDSTHAKLSVNGESTSKLQVGDTYHLTDGIDVGISEVLYQAYAGGVHSAKFFLGANKLVLKDGDITDSDSDSELTVDGDTIDGAEVIITGTDDNTYSAISTITISMIAQEDYYLPAGEKLSSIIDDPNLLFTKNWDFEFDGLTESKSHEIKLDASGSRKYELTFYDGREDQVELPLFYALDDTTISFGDEESALHLKEGISIHKNDYFVLTSGGDSFALQYKKSDEASKTGAKIEFKNLGNGNTLEYSIDSSSTDAGSAVCEINIGGYSFSVISDEDETSENFNIQVSLDGDSTVGSGEVNIRDYYDAQIVFDNIPATRLAAVDSSSLTITTPDSSDYDSQAPATIVLTADATATNKVTISSFTVGGNSNPLIGEGSTYYGYTSLGGKLTYSSPSGSPNSFTYDYPKEQREALLYITSEETTTVHSGLTPVNVTSEIKLDSEIKDVSAQNLIVIGGPCVNNIAASLMDEKDCSSGFVPGQAKIKLFGNDKIAMLIAGYDNSDTKMAVEFVANRWDELSGQEVTIEGSNYIDAVIVE